MPVSSRSSGLRWAAALVVAAAAALPLAAGATPSLAASAAPPGAAAPAGRHPIRVGSVVIAPCASSRLAWCTTINVPYQYVGRDPAAAGTMRAWLTVTGPGGVPASVRVRYLDYVPHSIATIHGRFHGRAIVATMPAP
jgi:hypothetical protein